MHRKIIGITGLVATAVFLMAESKDDVPEELKTSSSLGAYVNKWNEFQRPGLGQLFEWKFMMENHSNIPKDEKERDRVLPVLKLDKRKIDSAPEDKIQVTWLGHASVLAQFEGLTVLADPIFRDFCGPGAAGFPGMSKLAYWRYRKAPCTAEDLPKLDAVVISHNHFDHLDDETVREIAKRQPDITWFVGMGLESWMRKRGCNNVIEQDWWTEQKLTVELGCESNEKTFRFICVPTQHWSQRGPLDKNQTLWCSWIVKGASTSYYFAGDTGYYQPLFQTIGKKYGPFDLAAIPIGAYNPRSILEYQHVDPKQAVMIHQDIKSLCSIGIHWGTFKTSACEVLDCVDIVPIKITEYQHVDPEEAVKIHQDVQAKQSIGIHWGTFEVTNEFYLEPPRKVEEWMKAAKRSPEEFISINHGETWVVGEPRDRSVFMDEPPVSE